MGIGLLLDVCSICQAKRDQHRRAFRCLIFYSAAIFLVEATTEPAWLFKEGSILNNIVNPYAGFWAEKSGAFLHVWQW